MFVLGMLGPVLFSAATLLWFVLYLVRTMSGNHLTLQAPPIERIAVLNIDPLYRRRL